MKTQILETTDNLTIESAIEKVKAAGYILTQSRHWYITGRGEVYNNDHGKRNGRQAFLGAYATKEQAEQARDDIKSKYGNK